MKTKRTSSHQVGHFFDGPMRAVPSKSVVTDEPADLFEGELCTSGCHTMQSRFRCNSLKTKEGDAHKVTHKLQARAMIAVALLIFALRLSVSAQVIDVDHGPNAAAQQAKHYVVLVSLDGFRYDYAAKYGATNLARIAAEGASAPDGMIPSFPSFTFPNHLAIVTGLYPEHHGIVENDFYDPAREQHYAYDKPDSVQDGSWYHGVPLWVLAEKQGMRSACFFWPGSEAEIDGMRPSHYIHYDKHVLDEQRIEQVIAWLKVPAAQRPHFITLYYSQPDSAGHDFGPESSQTAEAVRHVDALIGILAADLKALKLPVDLIVVSDHGMATVEGNWIDLDKFADLSQLVTDGALLYAPSEEAAARAYQQLRGASDKFVVYRRADVPAHLHFNGNPRSGDPVVIATGPYKIRAHASETPEIVQPNVKGEHGYDPRQMKSMRPIFYAVGPDIRPGIKVPPFENVDVYPLIAKILGLQIGTVDGHLDAVRNILRSSIRNSPTVQ
jgi:predicted AlkP superfamily pyrophosphatase or phosphodiesterase